MANRKIVTGEGEDAEGKTVRASVSFPEEQYAEIERIARRQRVSLAWVVRDAVQEYLTSRWPLLEAEQQDNRRERQA